MANGMAFDPEARYAALDERVTNIGTRVTALDTRVTEGFQAMSAQFGALASEIRTGQKTPWGVIWSAIGVFITFVVVIGGLAYWPIRESTTRLEDAQIKLTETVRLTVDGLPDRFITRLETERLSTRAAEEREAERQRIIDLENTKLDRAEWMLRNNLVDRIIQDVMKTIEPLARQSDVAENRSRIERLEAAVFTPAFGLP